MISIELATAYSAVAFLAGCGAAYICHAIIRAALGIPLYNLDLDEPQAGTASWRQEPGPIRDLPALPARARFATPLPAIVLSPAEWARRSFDDPTRVRLAVHIGEGVLA